MEKERNDQEFEKMIIPIGSLLVAEKDTSYKNGNNKFELKAGSQVLVGFDNLLHPLGNNDVALTLDENMQVDSYSANGMAAYISAWLRSCPDLKKEIENKGLETEKLEEEITKSLITAGMEFIK